MVYGTILLEHTKWEPTEQRVGIQAFAKKIGLKIDKILSYTEKPDFSGIKNNDTIIFYDWNCICNSRKDISKYVEQFVKNHICVYSAQSKLSMYEAGNTMYAIGKKLKLTSSSVIRFLISRNKRKPNAK